jgi:Zn-dependent M16 (insulinase) family peptidase
MFQRNDMFQNSSVLSLTDVIRRYEAANSTEILQGTHRAVDHQVVRAQPNAAASVSPRTSASASLHSLIPLLSLQQQMIAEIGRLRREYEQLEANLMAYTGEADLSSLASVDELDELERQLETALSKVRARKVMQVPFPSNPTKFCMNTYCIYA